VFLTIKKKSWWWKISRYANYTGNLGCQNFWKMWLRFLNSFSAGSRRPFSLSFEKCFKVVALLCIVSTVSIHSLLHVLSARICPMSPDFLTKWVFRLLVSWAFAHVGVHRLSLCLPYLGVFSICASSPAVGFRASTFHSDGICTSRPTLLLYPSLEIEFTAYKLWLKLANSCDSLHCISVLDI